MLQTVSLAQTQNLPAERDKYDCLSFDEPRQPRKILISLTRCDKDSNNDQSMRQDFCQSFSVSNLDRKQLTVVRRKRVIKL